MPSGQSNNIIIDEDYSESQTTMNPEQFEDEPGTNAYNNSNMNSNVYPHGDPNRPTNNNPYDNRYSINDDYDENAPENDPYGPSSSQPRQYAPEYQNENDYNHNHNNDHNDYDDNAPPSSSHEEQAVPPPRQHKYTTANLREQGKWKKWCKILLIFLLVLAIMIGISMLMNHFFFGDTSDNGLKAIPPRDENGTFPMDKQDIDAACGRSTLATDEGTLCKEACIPNYFHCCDPFDEFLLYNYTVPTSNSTNSTTSNSTNTTTVDDGKLSSDNNKEPDAKNLTFLEGYTNDGTCTFDQNVRGCMAYAKCQALAGQADPAPANLLDLCSLERLKEDPDSCDELCRQKNLDCCFSKEKDNCLAEKFDLCMDYAPCQNLRSLDNPEGVLEIAPRSLDYDCYYQQPSCTETCEKASCCSAVGDFSCLQYNFLSCITYAPCSNVTVVNITIPPQFNHLSQPSVDLVLACEKDVPILEPTDRSCESMCNDAACCWSKTDNCFHLDPLGCLAYEAQCQSLLPE